MHEWQHVGYVLPRRAGTHSCMSNHWTLDLESLAAGHFCTTVDTNTTSIWYGHRLECDMATNIKKEEAANAPKARAATLQTDLNRLENVKVRPDIPQPFAVSSAPQPLCNKPGIG